MYLRRTLEPTVFLALLLFASYSPTPTQTFDHHVTVSNRGMFQSPGIDSNTGSEPPPLEGAESNSPAHPPPPAPPPSSKAPHPPPAPPKVYGEQPSQPPSPPLHFHPPAAAVDDKAKVRKEVGKKVGLAFLGVALAFQLVLGAVLVYKRRNIQKVLSGPTEGNASSSSSSHPPALPRPSAH